MTTDEELRLTAHHEAGHAVAAVMRGHTLRTITIRLSDGLLGHTLYRGHTWDHAFIAWAGPWAQARCQWSLDGTVELDDEHPEEGHIFADELVGAFMSGGMEDHQAVREGLSEAVAALERQDPALAQEVTHNTEQTWCMELCGMWTVIQQVAQWLLEDRTVTHDDVYELIYS